MDSKNPFLPPHHRRSIRLPGYDYSSDGAYFITLVTHHRESLFGEITANQMHLNPYGHIVRAEWLRSAHIRSEIELYEYIIMPNHFHGIFFINRHNDESQNESTGAHGHAPLLVNPQFRSPSRTVGSLVRGFKSSVTKQINLLRDTPGLPVWQRNYYEHIISTDREYDQIAEYIYNNPQNWQTDSENC